MTEEIHLINKSTKFIQINITTLCPTRYFYILQYKNVRKYIIDYHSDSPLWFEGKGGHDSWGYDELSCLNDGYFKHEILLHSGATIMLEFKKFNYSRIRIENKLLIQNQKWQDILKSIRE